MRTILITSLLLLASYSLFAQPADRDYADLLGKTVMFFEAQTCGPKPSFSRFDWRGDCHTSDGSEAGVDLTGGWHDAGDHVKFHYPMMQAVTMLSWSYLDYPESYTNTNNKVHLLNNLRFIGDYLIKLHPSPNELWAQVALGSVDHQFWEEPEENTYTRNVYKLDPNKPGTDLACSMAAAMASLSMTFAEEDPAYSSTLLQHAKELFTFGDTYRGRYSDQVPDGNFYKSNRTFIDDIVWGALWLYKATGETSYLDKAEAEFPNVANDVTGWTMWFADKQYGSALLLAQIRGAEYYDEVEQWLDQQIDNGQYTPGGLRFVDPFFPVPLSMSLSFSAYFYAEVRGSGFSKYNKYRNFAFNQVNYALGNNPRGASYVVGFGSNFPMRTHHRAAHSPTAGQIDCCPDLDAHELTGALVGGPDANDNFENRRGNVPQSEMAVNTNGIFAALIAQMVKETGATAPTDPNPEPPMEGNVVFSARGTSGSEQLEVRYNDQAVGQPITLSTGSQEYRVQVDNPTGNFKVAFINDTPDRDVVLDWLRVEAVQKEAEDQEVNTASFTQQGGCGSGSFTQDMYCAGYIDFGTFGDGTPDPEPPVGGGGTIVIRAKGSTGSELMRLQVGDQLVESWENVSTTATDYTYEGYSGGVIHVLFDNDNPGAVEADRNLAVDYITVCGVEQPAEQAARSSCGETADGYAWLWCDGSLGFGDVGCSSAASVDQAASGRSLFSPGVSEVRVYPNPAQEQIVVQGPERYRVALYDLYGTLVQEQLQQSGRSQLNVVGVPAGVYLLQVLDIQTQQRYRQKVIIE